MDRVRQHGGRADREQDGHHLDRQVVRYGAAALVAAGLVFWALRLHGDPYDGRKWSFALLSGAAFGALLQRSRFCVASAFRDLFLLRDRRVMLGLLAALAVGSLGYLVIFGARNPSPQYLPVIGHINGAGPHFLVGGFSFGVGMVLAGGCISGNLYRLGEGSVAALAGLGGTFVGYWVGFAAWHTIYVNLVATKLSPVVWFPQLLGYAGAFALQMGLFAALAALLLWKLPGLPPRPGEPATLRSALRRVFVDGWPTWVGGAAIGVLATLVYLRDTPLGVTSQISDWAHRQGKALGLAPAVLTGLSEMRGCKPPPQGVILGDNGLLIVGLVAGSLLAALLSGEFRVRLAKPRTLVLALAGGVLLGFGSMISLGCTVGTLLSGIMAYSLSGWLFAGGLLAGAWAGGKTLRALA